MRRTLLAAAALAAFAMTTTANAAITLSLGSGSNFAGFDNASVGDTSGSFASPYGTTSWTTGSSSFATNTSAGGQYLQPLNDSSTYIFATGGGSDATVSWTTSVTSALIYWGSPDNYNTLTLSNGNSITGAAVLALTGTGSGDNAGSRWIWITDTNAFTGFTASSTRAAFEFDVAAVPEASTWALLGLGFGGLAFAGYRGRRRSAIAIV